jgi:hypothetical protein
VDFGRNAIHQAGRQPTKPRKGQSPIISCVRSPAGSRQNDDDVDDDVDDDDDGKRWCGDRLSVQNQCGSF